MKRLFLLIIFVVAHTLYGQVPQSFKYQAVLRDAIGNLRANEDVSIVVAILEGSANGTQVFMETHNTSTNEFGLINLDIGSINVNSFLEINWANGPVFIKISVDGVEMGTSQLLSVPYALMAKTSESISGTITETDPVFDASASSVITLTDITSWNNAFSWGDHGTAGYLTNFTETDPVFTVSPANGIISGDITNWNTAFSWGNHSSAGYAILPSQTDNNGKVLSTNGISPIWITPVISSDLDLKVNKSGDNMTGKLSINNASDRTALELNSNGHTEIRIKSGASYIPSIIIGTTADGPQAEGAYIQYIDKNYGTSSKISFHLPPSNNVLSLLNNGNVGIGTNEPSTKLQVNGIISATGGNSTLWNSKQDKLTAGTDIDISNNTISVIHSTYQIGDFAHGGIVFWVDETGKHGLVCAKTDQSTSMRWYAGSYTYTMARGDGPFSGEMNTAIIIANQGYGDGDLYAARVCSELQIIEGGKTYGDWFLPSREELDLMYQNKQLINSTAITNGGSPFAEGTNAYWGSTELVDNENVAITKLFGNGLFGVGSKEYTLYVRAIRSF